MTAADEIPVSVAAELYNRKQARAYVKQFLLAWGIGLIIAVPLLVVIDQICVSRAGTLISVVGQLRQLSDGSVVAVVDSRDWRNAPKGPYYGDFTLTVTGKRSGLPFLLYPDTRRYVQPVTLVRIFDGFPAAVMKWTTYTASTVPPDSPAAIAIDKWCRTKATPDERAAWQGTLKLVDRSIWRFVLGWLLLACLLHILLMTYFNIGNLRQFFVRRARHKHGQCLDCGYSLNNLPTPRVCPECGTPG